MRNKIVAADEAGIARAASIVRNGGVVVIPTDTNMGLAVDPWNLAAIDRVFAIKRRAAIKPLTLYIDRPEQWREYGTGSPAAVEQIDILAGRFWPGPLNIIAEAREAIRTPMLCGQTTIAISCVSNTATRAIVAQSGKPLALTSANISGTADDRLVDMDFVLGQIGEDVDLIVEGGAQNTTKSTTIVAVIDEPKLLREGDLNWSRIAQALGLPEARGAA
ncbi:MAG TPA: L-threonylcarbamoyladenylate synthase [Stellaceae bacterium]|jgi:L-threonylcarbamoyladenylate synthase